MKQNEVVPRRLILIYIQEVRYYEPLVWIKIDYPKFSLSLI